MLIPIDIWALLEQGPPVLTAFVIQLAEEKQELEAENARLREQVNRNPTNSHTPPSKNTFVKPGSLRQRTGRKPGGQPGHPGKTLHWVQEPDVIVEHRPDRCEHCQANIPSDTPVQFGPRRQIIEVEIRRVTREHRTGIVTCPNCGLQTSSDFPTGLDHYLQYGPEYKALMLYLNQGNFVPYNRLAQLSRDVLQIPVSAGTLSRFVQVAAPALEQSIQCIAEKIKQAPVVCFDETGSRVLGKLKWRHSASTDQFTLLYTHERRGKEAMDAAGILPGYTGCAVHDCWKPYFRVLSCRHALCNAHLLRELNGIEDNDKQVWPQQMKAVLLDAKTLRETKAFPLPQAECSKLFRRYDAAIRSGCTENPVKKASPGEPKKRGRKTKSKARNLLERMAQYKENILLFLQNPEVPFDNNLALYLSINYSEYCQKVS